MPPVLEQARRLGRDLPVVRVRQRCATASTWLRTSLMIEVGSYCCSAVESPLPSSKTIDVCVAEAAALLRLGDRRDELGAAAPLDDLLRRLALRVELPVPGRIRIGRVQDRLLERNGHP